MRVVLERLGDRPFDLAKRRIWRVWGLRQGASEHLGHEAVCRLAERK
jgi:hypothetical protein